MLERNEHSQKNQQIQNFFKLHSFEVTQQKKECSLIQQNQIFKYTLLYLFVCTKPIVVRLARRINAY